MVENESEAILERLKFIKEELPVIRDQSYTKLVANKRYEKTHYDKKVSPTKYKLNDQVLRAVTMTQHKFSVRWVGPYRIVRVLDHGTCISMDNEDNKDHFNGERLKPYNDRGYMIPDVAPSNLRTSLQFYKSINLSDQDV
ncbi:hypothetical protein AX774_g7170 [Zancudomyces culisetae]|uniref:Uncharacterized protein n=1 Tax=Zancudomyces culisetae TaxID=1213189 RepID=A0A1R1PES4_ZANCU|nr:hypothetical protein AX774_g7170 [Zancudomyces culisetae]|eukprot:OMH79413.1 hypothetical protein AX774_g7170 [Zancudomyces culisetae]